MRHILLHFVIAISFVATAVGETPREFVRRFYAASSEWKIRGVPLPEHERLISQFCGIEIIRVFRRVNDQRDLWERRFPHDPSNPIKPPWCIEKDVFCDNWEGITNYSVGRSLRMRGRIVVEVHLEFVEQSERYRWTDRVILDRAGDSWVVSDIDYAGGGSLLESTQKELKLVARELN